MTNPSELGEAGDDYCQGSVQSGPKHRIAGCTSPSEGYQYEDQIDPFPLGLTPLFLFTNFLGGGLRCRAALKVTLKNIVSEGSGCPCQFHSSRNVPLKTEVLGQPHPDGHLPFGGFFGQTRIIVQIFDRKTNTEPAFQELSYGDILLVEHTIFKGKERV